MNVETCNTKRVRAWRIKIKNVTRLQGVALLSEKRYKSASAVAEIMKFFSNTLNNIKEAFGGVAGWFCSNDLLRCYRLCF
jgi:hypothetical protein